MKIFVDTNILLDVLAKRDPFYVDHARISSLAERAKSEAQVSVVSFNNIYYVVRRAEDRKAAEQALRLMRSVFTPVPLTIQVLNQAIDSGLRDFEDAIQFHSAIFAGADCLSRAMRITFPPERCRYFPLRSSCRPNSPHKAG